MAKLTLHPPTAQNSPQPGRGRRVFVSYSHLDSALALAFFSHFSLLIQDPALRVAPGGVFFDRQRLKAGEDWDESIQVALEQADLLIFLVSVNALNSKFCMQREVKSAAQRGLPLIPVLLADCPWAHLRVPGCKQGKLLGALGALPKDDHFSLAPVANWPNSARAWTAVMDGLRKKLEENPPAAGAARAGQAAAAPAHLPYLCDQDHAASRFDLALGGWDKQALVVLLKGVYDDNPAGFWGRLHHHSLRERVELRQLNCLEAKPLAWPPLDGLPAREAAALLRYEVSLALTGNRYQIASAAQLGPALAALDGVQALQAILPSVPAKALRAGLAALLELLEAAENADLSRLVVVLILEDDTLLDAENLARQWKLQRFRRSQVVELPRLSPVGREQVRLWHHQHCIEKRFRIEEADLLDQVFAQAPQPFRLRHFDAIVTPLLKP